MKKVVLGLLVLGQLGMAKDWYYVALDNKEITGVGKCIHDNKIDPIGMSSMEGVEVEKQSDGIYRMIVKRDGGVLANMVYLNDSMKKCNLSRNFLIERMKEVRKL